MCDGLFARASPLQPVCNLANPDRTHNGQGRIESAGEQSPDFFHGAGIHHLDKARIASRIELLTRGEQNQGVQSDGIAQSAFTRFLPFGHGPLGGTDDFQCPCHARGIVGVERRGPGGVFTAERGISIGEGQGAHLFADERIDRRDRGNTLQQSADVEPGAANQDRHRTLGMQRVDFRCRCQRPIGGGTGDSPIPGAEQAVFYPLHLLRRRTGAEHCQIGIDLRAVGVDDRRSLSGTLQPLRQFDRQCALAARGRPCNERQRRQPGRHNTEIPLLIARLIADPHAYSTTLDQATAALEAHGMRVAMAQLVDANSPVLQISLPEGDAATVAGILDEHFRPSDLLLTDEEIRVPHVFVSDMDSTMIGQECIHHLADFAGIKPQIAEITERAMQGELDFESALRERVLLLRNLAEEAISECLSTRIVPMPGAKTLVATLKSKGCRTVLVTGGFHQFADPVAEQLGFERVVGNRLEVSGGVLTGGLVGAIVDSASKKAAVDEVGEGAVTLATGDGANDAAMLSAATMGVAFRAKPIVAAAARARVDHTDLTTLLYAQGYRAAEIVPG